jgi:hypothetical protein
MTGTEISRHRRRRIARRIRQTVALRRLTRDRVAHLAGPDEGRPTFRPDPSEGSPSFRPNPDGGPPPFRFAAATAPRDPARSGHDTGTATDTAARRPRHDRPVPVRRSPTLAWASIAATAPE